MKSTLTIDENQKTSSLLSIYQNELDNLRRILQAVKVGKCLLLDDQQRDEIKKRKKQLWKTIQGIADYQGIAYRFEKKLSELDDLRYISKQEAEFAAFQLEKAQKYLWNRKDKNFKDSQQNQSDKNVHKVFVFDTNPTVSIRSQTKNRIEVETIQEVKDIEIQVSDAGKFNEKPLKNETFTDLNLMETKNSELFQTVFASLQDFTSDIFETICNLDEELNAYLTTSQKSSHKKQYLENMKTKLIYIKKMLQKAYKMQNETETTLSSENSSISEDEIQKPTDSKLRFELIETINAEFEKLDHIFNKEGVLSDQIKNIKNVGDEIKISKEILEEKFRELKLKCADKLTMSLEDVEMIRELHAKALENSLRIMKTLDENATILRQTTVKYMADIENHLKEQNQTVEEEQLESDQSENDSEIQLEEEIEEKTHRKVFLALEDFNVKFLACLEHSDL